MMPVLLDSLFEPMLVNLYPSHQKLCARTENGLKSFTKVTLLISNLTVKIFEEGSSMAYNQLLPFFLIWFYEYSNRNTYCMRKKLYGSGPLVHKRPKSTYLCPGGIKIATEYPTMSEDVIDAWNSGNLLKFEWFERGGHCDLPVGYAMLGYIKPRWYDYGKQRLRIKYDRGIDGKVAKTVPSCFLMCSSTQGCCYYD
jgi:hypothetical protein